MASRHVVSQQARVGEQAPVAGKQMVKKNGGAADGRNRRALGDIGNVVTAKGVEGKADGKKVAQQITRPVTRSFRAQLLANAQNAAAEKNKKQVCVNVGPSVLPDGAVAPKRAAAPKVATKKVLAKPKTQEVADAGKGSKEEANKIVDKKEKLQNDKKKERGSSKKTVKTLTSVLTARSKAACGISNRPKQQIVDIDAADMYNELAVVEYVEDLYKFYKLVENESRPTDYIGLQPDLNQQMRSILVDWLIEVHYKFELMPETLYLTISIIDRFLSVKAVPRRELQLLGVGALLIASKYEEIWAPEVHDLIAITDGAYAREQILMMEKAILGRLEWTLTLPTPYVFLARFIKASVPDKEGHMENMVYFLAELGIMNYAIVMHCPSMIAASAVYAARCTLSKTPAWNETLQIHTGFSEPEMMECAKQLVSFHAKATDTNNKLKSVYRKYSSPLRGAVAVFPPAKSLLPTV